MQRNHVMTLRDLEELVKWVSSEKFLDSEKLRTIGGVFQSLVLKDRTLPEFEQEWLFYNRGFCNIMAQLLTLLYELDLNSQIDGGRCFVSRDKIIYSVWFLSHVLIIRTIEDKPSNIITYWHLFVLANHSLCNIKQEKENISDKVFWMMCFMYACIKHKKFLKPFVHQGGLKSIVSILRYQLKTRKGTDLAKLQLLLILKMIGICAMTYPQSCEDLCIKEMFITYLIEQKEFLKIVCFKSQHREVLFEILFIISYLMQINYSAESISCVNELLNHYRGVHRTIDMTINKLVHGFHILALIELKENELKLIKGKCENQASQIEIISKLSNETEFNLNNKNLRLESDFEMSGCLDTENADIKKDSDLNATGSLHDNSSGDSNESEYELNEFDCSKNSVESKDDSKVEMDDGNEIININFKSDEKLDSEPWLREKTAEEQHNITRLTEKKKQRTDNFSEQNKAKFTPDRASSDRNSSLNDGENFEDTQDFSNSSPQENLVPLNIKMGTQSAYQNSLITHMVEISTKMVALGHKRKRDPYESEKRKQSYYQDGGSSEDEEHRSNYSPDDYVREGYNTYRHESNSPPWFGWNLGQSQHNFYGYVPNNPPNYFNYSQMPGYSQEFFNRPDPGPQQPYFNYPPGPPPSPYEYSESQRQQYQPQYNVNVPNNAEQEVLSPAQDPSNTNSVSSEISLEGGKQKFFTSPVSQKPYINTYDPQSSPVKMESNNSLETKTNQSPYETINNENIFRKFPEQEPSGIGSDLPKEEKPLSLHEPPHTISDGSNLFCSPPDHRSYTLPPVTQNVTSSCGIDSQINQDENYTMPPQFRSFQSHPQFSNSRIDGSHQSIPITQPQFHHSMRTLSPESWARLSEEMRNSIFVRSQYQPEEVPYTNSYSYYSNSQQTIPTDTQSSDQGKNYEIYVESTDSERKTQSEDECEPIQCNRSNMEIPSANSRVQEIISLDSECEATDEDWENDTSNSRPVTRSQRKRSINLDYQDSSQIFSRRKRY